MSQFKEVDVGSIVYFWFAANDYTGARADGASPGFQVRLAGAAAGAAPTATGTPTLLTHASFSDGSYEVAIDSTGYTVGAEYAVFCTLLISSVNPNGFVGSFVVRAAALSTYEVSTAISARLPAALGADGFIKASLWGAMGTALTETAGQIAAAIVKFFNKAAPTGTINSLPDAAAGAANGLAIIDATGVKMTKTVDLTAGQSIACSDKTGFSLSATGLDLILYTSTFVQAIKTALEIAGGTLATLLARIVGTLDTGTHKPQSGDAYAIANAMKGTDGKVLVSTDAQDLSATLSVNAKKLNAATPNNLAAGAKMDLQDAPNATALAAVVDKFLGRNLAGGSDGGRIVKDALRSGRNRVVIDGGTITVYAEDDTTVAWTGGATRVSGLDPLQEIDPA